MGGVRFLISALISKWISDFWMQISADFNWFHHSVYEISTVASPSTNTQQCYYAWIEAVSKIMHTVLS